MLKMIQISLDAHPTSERLARAEVERTWISTPCVDQQSVGSLGDFLVERTPRNP